MKISERTVSLLKNFSSVNSGIVLNPGNRIRTMSADRSILIDADIEEHIPIQIGIYDLNQFLGNVTTMTDPEIVFGENGNQVHIKDEDTDILYRCSSPSLIFAPPADKNIQIDEPEIVFDLTEKQITKIVRLASMNSLPYISIVGKNKQLYLFAHEENVTEQRNEITSVIGDWEGPDLKATFKTKLLIMLPRDYKVEVKMKAFARFLSKSDNLKYFISLESKK